MVPRNLVFLFEHPEEETVATTAILIFGSLLGVSLKSDLSRKGY